MVRAVPRCQRRKHDEHSVGNIDDGAVGSVRRRRVRVGSPASMSGHSVSAAHGKIIGPMVLGSASPNGHRQRAPEENAENASDSTGSLRLLAIASPSGVATPSVVDGPLGSTASGSSEVTGSGRRRDGGVGDAGARAVLLATKLHVPAIGAQLVHRAALLDALSEGRRRKVTLLSAPAGWGKTTVLAQWTQRAGEDQPFGWLSVDSSDNDPVWFWMYVIAALQKVSPGVGVRALELLAMSADPEQVVLPTLLNDLDTITTPMVLILDDYHQVVNRAVHEQLAFFISRLPANLHLVLSTRSDPLLPLARLRASGDLAEVRTDDLRFGASETHHLLNEVLG